MTNPGAGGIPPSGADMNGILYTTTAWNAFTQAGQWPEYNVDVSAAISGYIAGAVLFAPGVGAFGDFFWNRDDGNTNDPASDVSGWRCLTRALYESVAADGTEDDWGVLPGPSDYVLDVDTTGGNLDITGIASFVDGQKIYLTNTGANLLQLLSLNGGSSAQYQFRLPSDFALVQNQTITLMYSEGIQKWLAI
jgi:hypothetical protein